VGFFAMRRVCAGNAAASILRVHDHGVIHFWISSASLYPANAAPFSETTFMFFV
jgi:hypothetical protein